MGFGGVAGLFGMSLLWLTFLNIFVGIFIGVPTIYRQIIQKTEYAQADVLV